jgi:hypothetical protein
MMIGTLERMAVDVALLAGLLVLFWLLTLAVDVLFRFLEWVMQQLGRGRHG